MLQPQNKTIGGKTFQFLPMPALKAARLDKKVLTALTPLLSSLTDVKSVASAALGEEGGSGDMAGIATGLTQCLQALDDSSFASLLRELLEHVTYLPNGQAPMPLGNESTIDLVFVGDLATMYQVAVEVMRYNKFTPFGLADIGGSLLQTVGSVKPSASTKKSGLKLAPSAS